MIKYVISLILVALTASSVSSCKMFHKDKSDRKTTKERPYDKDRSSNKDRDIQIGFSKDTIRRVFGEPDSVVQVHSPEYTTIDEIWLYIYDKPRFADYLPRALREREPTPNSELARMLREYPMEATTLQGILALGFRGDKVADIAVRTNFK
jgi:hypothetical protein